MKKPAFACQLTPAALDAKNVLDNEQNDQMNSCLAQALKMLQAKHLAVMGMRKRLVGLSVAGVQQKLKDAILEEVATSETELAQEIQSIQSAWIDMKEVAYLETKAEKLNKSGAVLSNAEELIKQGDGLLKRNSQ